MRCRRLQALVLRLVGAEGVAGKREAVLGESAAVVK
jgi:hypothetical protein